MEILQYNLTRELQELVASKSISTLFQPIVSLKDGEVLGYEALSRGPRNSSLYNPQLLFEVAREHDMLWDLELLCRSKALENSANKLMGSKLFINIEPNIIQDKSFQKGFTKELLQQYNIKPSDIIFEITENTAIEDYNKLRLILDNYSEQGYDIAIDDTGSGYSGLVLLAETHPNFIKIDMNLIRDIDKNKFKQDLIKTFYEFSRNTKVDIIAEGIETESELQALIDIGVQYGQGYFIQKPEDRIKKIDDSVVNIIKKLNHKNQVINDKDFSQFHIGLIARRDDSIELNTTVDEVNELFSIKYTLQGIPVTKDKKPVGLVMRNKFYYQLLRKNNEEIYEKPIETIMTKLPLIVDYYSPFKDVAKMSMSRREESLYDYIIVVKDNSYYGIVPISSVVDSLVKISN